MVYCRCKNSWNQFKLNFIFWVSSTLKKLMTSKGSDHQTSALSVTRSLPLLLHTALIWSYQFYVKWMKQSQCLFVKCLQSCKMPWWDVMAPAGTVISQISATLSWLSSHGYWSSPTLQHLTMSLTSSARLSLAKTNISGVIIGLLVFSVLPAVYQCHQIFTNTPPWVYPGLEPHKHPPGPSDGWISNVHSYGAWLIRIVPIVDIWQ